MERMGLKPPPPLLFVKPLFDRKLLHASRFRSKTSSAGLSLQTPPTPWGHGPTITNGKEVEASYFAFDQSCLCFAYNLEIGSAGMYLLGTQNSWDLRPSPKIDFRATFFPSKSAFPTVEGTRRGKEHGIHVRGRGIVSGVNSRR